ncbi:hypothetical protein HY995_00215 [Candidatus Micrarchaeota archaeon]|nr:hypothetical protein [Candidatus Micrarchaeota archaeon]
MKLTSRQTYKVVRAALERGRFKQVDLEEAAGVSFGLVNRAVRWMVSRKFVSKEGGQYEVIAPAALAGAFSLFRQLGEARPSSFSVDADGKTLLKALKEHGAVLCLTSALSYYGDYPRDPVVSVYADKALADSLKRMAPGGTRVEIFSDDLGQKGDFVEMRGVRLTSRVRTIIDLLCSEKSYAAGQLMKKTWEKA